MGKGIVAIVVVVLLVIVGIFCIDTVPTGHTGIPVTWGAVENYTVSEGLQIKPPWRGIVKMDNREQKATFSTQAFSKDIQQVNVTGSLNYSIDKANAMTLYRDVGTNYLDTIVAPRLMETLKATFSKYTAENLIEARSTLSDAVRDALAEEMSAKGINIISINIEDIDFADAFTDAVEQKQVAAQTKLRVQTEQATITATKQAEAERSIIQANADAEIVKIQAESAKFAGEKEAEMNRKLAESLSPELVQYYYAQRWNGVLPQYTGGDNMPIIDLRPTATVSP